MSTRTTVVDDAVCESCGAELEVTCPDEPQPGRVPHYPVTCPACGVERRLLLPGPVQSVRVLPSSARRT